MNFKILSVNYETIFFNLLYRRDLNTKANFNQKYLSMLERILYSNITLMNCISLD